jgi:hypothetical protein
MMLPKTNQDSLPQVVLRVPGPWKDCKELMARLPPGFRIQGERYLMPEGPDLGFDSFPADSKFPSVFRIACRRPSSDRGWSRALENYAMNAAVYGPAGSLNAAQHLLEAGAGLIRAGGLGVFIDNSVLAHVGSDWLELAEHRSDPDAVFYAFVNVVEAGTGILSRGMQVIGQRDGIVPQRGELNSLEEFLRGMCAELPEMGEGEVFADEEGRCFCLHGEPDQGIFPNHPVNNPYGRWRLELMKD